MIKHDRSSIRRFKGAMFETAYSDTYLDRLRSSSLARAIIGILIGRFMLRTGHCRVEHRGPQRADFAVLAANAAVSGHASRAALVRSQAGLPDA